MISRWRLPWPRRYVWLLMGSLAGVCVLASVAAALLLHAGIAPGWVMLDLTGTLVLAVAATGWHIDRRLAHPVVTLARSTETLTHTDAEHASELPQRHWLGRLPAAIAAMDKALTRSEMELTKAATSWANDRDHQRWRVEALLTHTTEGILLCDAADRVQLYNRAARELLGDPPALARGVSLHQLLDPTPVTAALKTLQHRHRGMHVTSLTTHAGDGTQLTGHLAAKITAADDYLLVVHEWNSDAPGPYAERRAIRDAAATARQAMATTLNDEGVGTRRLIAASEALADLAEAGARAERCLPLISASRLFDALERRGAAITLRRAGADGLRLRAHIGYLADALALLPGALARSDLSLSVSDSERGVQLIVETQATGDGDEGLEAWLGQPLPETTEPLTVAQCIAAHDGQCRPAPTGTNHAGLSIDLAGCRKTAGPRPTATAAFAHSHRAGATRPIESVDAVVFDTETTGLDPSMGDAIVALGAVRVRGGAIVEDEVFDRLVNPGVPIPAVSTRCHGITDADVELAEPVSTVLRDFHAFSGNAVLVAHNAAFDMRFIQRSESTAGVHFANPVLDTLLLSLLVHDHAREHSLEAIARRLGVDVSVRHSALGDALTTARIFTHLRPLLPAAGLRTVGDVERASRSLVEYRRQQRAF